MCKYEYNYSVWLYFDVWTLCTCPSPLCLSNIKNKTFHTFRSLFYKQLIQIYFPKLHFIGKKTNEIPYIFQTFYFCKSVKVLHPLSFLAFCIRPSFFSSSSIRCAAWPRCPFTPKIPASLFLMSSLFLHSTSRWPSAHAASLPSHAWSTYFQLFFMLKTTVV